MNVTLDAASLSQSFNSQANVLQQSESSQNVVFISIDDLNDWVGVLDGYVDVKTPNIDRLASQGMLFKNAHTPVPVCNAARTAAMTGLQPDTTGIFDNGQDWREIVPDGETLPEFFRENGYEAVGAGKLFHIQDASVFDQYFQASDAKAPKRLKGRFGSAALDVPLNQYRDVQVANAASDYLGQNHSDPFFLGVGFSRPHSPLAAPQEFFDLYPLDEIRLPNEQATDDLSDVPALGKQLAGKLHQSILKKGDWAEIVQAYLANISFVDAQVGTVLDAIESNGLSENTVVALWSDHGWHLGEKLHWQKRSLWEEATRVPLIVSAPGVTEPGSTTNAPVSLVDLFPTLVDLTGVPPKTNVDGNSLLPLLKNPAAKWDNSVVSTWDKHYAVRTKRWRYIRYSDGTEELYDHRTDPDEFENLANAPKASTAKARLARELNDYFAEFAPEKAFGPQTPPNIKDQILRGENSDDVITGGPGNDTILGNGGDDRLLDGKGKNEIRGGDGNDFISHSSSKPGSLKGNSGQDTLIGGKGADTLDGGPGQDVLDGKGGRNTYVVDNIGDRIVNGSPNKGSTVISSVNWRLSKGFTELSLKGSARIGRGNAKHNRIKGSRSDNILFGHRGRDRISGGEGNDSLVGGADDDRLFGGKGNDTVVVHAQQKEILLSNDSVTGEGTDQLNSIENAVVEGHKGNNVIDASRFSGTSVLKGRRGDDILLPSQGATQLVGGKGADQFILNRPQGRNIQIQDFDSSEQDVIAISANILGSEFKPGDRILASQFFLGSRLQNQQQRFLFDPRTGSLSFDSDGAGGVNAKQIGTLTNDTNLTAGDLRIV